MAMEYIRAFLVGGLICMLVQILMDKTKMMPGRIMVLLVVSGSVLGFLGVYEPFAEWAGAGATVPLLGFGNTLWKGVVKAMAEDGVLGIFKGGFTASAVGISGALVENSVGAGIIGGFILWAISCLFFDYAWTDLTVAWWGVIAGAIIGLYLTYQEVKYMF